MSRLKRENHITIKAFMVMDLELSGNELIAYALVHGFSQDGESDFHGSLSYVAEWLNCSKTTAFNILNNLANDGFIKKKDKIVNGVKFCDYIANVPSEDELKEIKRRKEERKEKEKSERRSKNLNTVKEIEKDRSKNLNGYSKNLNEGVQKTLTHNTIDKLKENIGYNNSLSTERASESEPPKPKRQSRKKEANELYERIWKLYPKKIGKGQVSDTQKLKLLDIGFDELERAIQRCCQYNKDKDKQYWQNGSTFFNSGYIDFLDENYEDSSSPKVESVEAVQKDPLSEKERIRLGIERARETFGEEYGESYWSGMDDGEIEIMLEYLGIRINEL